MYAISLSDHLNIAQMAHQRRAKLLNLLLILLSLEAKSYGNACYVLFYTTKQRNRKNAAPPGKPEFWPRILVWSSPTGRLVKVNFARDKKEKQRTYVA